MWIWTRWPYPAQESSWHRMGFVTYIAVGGLLDSLPTYLFIYLSSRERISELELNHQPLRSEMGTSSLSRSSLRPSQTSFTHTHTHIYLLSFIFTTWHSHIGRDTSNHTWIYYIQASENTNLEALHMYHCNRQIKCPHGIEIGNSPLVIEVLCQSPHNSHDNWQRKQSKGF